MKTLGFVWRTETQKKVDRSIKNDLSTEIEAFLISPATMSDGISIDALVRFRFFAFEFWVILDLWALFIIINGSLSWSLFIFSHRVKPWGTSVIMRNSDLIWELMLEIWLLKRIQAGNIVSNLLSVPIFGIKERIGCVSFFLSVIMTVRIYRWRDFSKN